MKIVIIALLIIFLAAPAWARGPCAPPCYYPRPYCHHGGGGCGYGPALGIGAAALFVGIVAIAIVGSFSSARGDQAAKAMMDSALRANQYENYLIAMEHYNANSSNRVVPLSRLQWLRWRDACGLESLQ